MIVIAGSSALIALRTAAEAGKYHHVGEALPQSREVTWKETHLEYIIHFYYFASKWWMRPKEANSGQVCHEIAVKGADSAEAGRLPHEIKVYFTLTAITNRLLKSFQNGHIHSQIVLRMENGRTRSLGSPRFTAMAG